MPPNNQGSSKANFEIETYLFLLLLELFQSLGGPSQVCVINTTQHLSNTSKVSKVWHKRCYPCTLKTNALGVCAMVVRDTQGSARSQKHGMCKRKMHFLHVFIGKDQNLQQHAESAMFVQDKPVKKRAFTRSYTGWKPFGGTSLRQPKSKKMYSTTHRRFAKLPKPITLQFRKNPQAPQLFNTHSEAWSHRPPCQAPGLCSFLANFIALQVNVRNRRVDFQCFGKGLTKNDGKPCETWELTRRSATH